MSAQAKPGEVVPGQTHAELDLPPAPPPLVATTDRPITARDRTSAMGVVLGECVAKSDYVVVDPEAWEPVVLLGDVPSQFMWAPPVAIRRDHPITFVGTPSTYRGETTPVVGLLRSDVASTEVITPAGTPVPVDHGVFSAMLPEPPWATNLTTVLRDGTGKELYRGPLSNAG